MSETAFTSPICAKLDDEPKMLGKVGAAIAEALADQSVELSNPQLLYVAIKAVEAIPVTEASAIIKALITASTRFRDAVRAYATAEEIDDADCALLDALTKAGQ